MQKLSGGGGGTLAFPESQQGGADLEAPAAEVVQEGLQQVCVPRPLQARPQVLADLIVKLHSLAADIMIFADALCLVCAVPVQRLREKPLPWGTLWCARQMHLTREWYAMLASS